ncbi:uncharacterized protein MONOS_6486 [Monocercomonoides exilis]|uniref:uncharacterized protein n=1 Tax=Monocercomonoides exilis TaxID=2049356 RepID=UPI003559432F|nr:hypothetical protein MONOS_6486 [Monocercomonoides exilis]|eukprot:MONOS_6486.1-p1 / transcript=MONOS_6486.1 / gene=MONOS_6486 / organism=Monocercomonoides_exilis_PA203 / gene_product=unspecified product / transcript_product=unspecified product / location=Mono_scaffold00205:5996-14940(-) / protein_length=2958 / sequence_SO=supercontig / SO=protein_coding / is_pseudo=false
MEKKEKFINDLKSDIFGIQTRDSRNTSIEGTAFCPPGTALEKTGQKSTITPQKPQQQQQSLLSKALFGTREKPPPSKLDQSLVSFKKFFKSDIALDTFSTEAMWYYASANMDKYDASYLLKIIPSFTLPSIASVTAKAHKYDLRFGNLNHSFTKDQLLQIRKKDSSFLSENSFVTALIQSMMPTSDENWEYDLTAQRAFYDELWDLAVAIPPASSSQKVTLMGSVLHFDWITHEPSKKRFDEFVSIPLYHGAYIQRESSGILGSMGISGGRICSLNTSLLSMCKLPSYSVDTLLDDYLLFILQEEKSFSQYSKIFRPDFLRRKFIEAKMLCGAKVTQAPAPGKTSNKKGEYAVIQAEDTNFVDALKSKVELTFSTQNRVVFHYQDTVDLEVLVKNVKTVVLRVFEIDTVAYYKRFKKEIGIDINLDGMMTADEETFDFSSVPSCERRTLHLHLRQLDNKRGVFVAVVSGGGNISRALIRKGSLRLVTRCLPDGHAAMVADESNAILDPKRVTVSVDGVNYSGKRRKRSQNRKDKESRYQANGGDASELGKEIEMESSSERDSDDSDEEDDEDEDDEIQNENKPTGKKGEFTDDDDPNLCEGEFVIPFASSSASEISMNKTVIVIDNKTGFACLCPFLQYKEHYKFRCGVFIDREELIRYNEAHILIRPQLMCNSVPVSVSRIQEGSVTVIAKDLDGIPTTRIFEGLTFSDEEETVIPFQIPERLSCLEVTVRGSVKHFTENKHATPQQISHTQSFIINKIDKTCNVISASLYLHPARGYVASFFGKSGEFIPNLSVNCFFQFRAAKTASNSPSLWMQTDEHGELELGSLDDISSVRMSLPTGKGNMRSSLTFPVGAERNYGSSSDAFVAEKSEPSDTYRNISVGEEKNDLETYAYPQGAEFAIPFRATTKDDAKMVFLTLNTRDGKAKEDCTSELSFSKDKVILSKRLRGGDYELFDWKTGRRVFISIVGGNGITVAQRKRKTVRSHPEAASSSSTSSSSSSREIDQKTSEQGVVIGSQRIAQVSVTESLRIVSLKQKDDKIVVKLANTSPYTRLHFYGSRFDPCFDAHQLLKAAPLQKPEITEFRDAATTFVSNLPVGSEQHYIQNRKGYKPRLGNTLNVPSILVNPVVNCTTTQKEEKVIDAGKFDGGQVDSSSTSRRTFATEESRSNQRSNFFSPSSPNEDDKNIDFLVHPSSVLLNQHPPVGEKSEYELPMNFFKAGHTVLTVIAVDEERVITQRMAVRNKLNEEAEKREKEKEKLRAKNKIVGQNDKFALSRDPEFSLTTDMRFLHPFNPKAHYLETRSVSLVFSQKFIEGVFNRIRSLAGSGSNLSESSSSSSSSVVVPSAVSDLFKQYSSQRVIEDMSTSQVEMFDSLKSVFHLMISILASLDKENHASPMARLSNSTTLKQFRLWEESFSNWHQLSSHKRMERYSSFACHETDLFVYMKSPGLFKRYVAPFLRCKKEKTLLDHYLLNTRDLAYFMWFMQPSQFHRLNAFEQILVLDRVIDILDEKCLEIECELKNKHNDPGKSELEKKVAKYKKEADSFVKNFLRMIKQKIANSEQDAAKEKTMFEITLRSGYRPEEKAGKKKKAKTEAGEKGTGGRKRSHRLGIPEKDDSDGSEEFSEDDQLSLESEEDEEHFAGNRGNLSESDSSFSVDSDQQQNIISRPSSAVMFMPTLTSNAQQISMRQMQTLSNQMPMPQMFSNVAPMSNSAYSQMALVSNMAPDSAMYSNMSQMAAPSSPQQMCQMGAPRLPQQMCQMAAPPPPQQMGKMAQSQQTRSFMKSKIGPTRYYGQDGYRRLMRNDQSDSSSDSDMESEEMRRSPFSFRFSKKRRPHIHHTKAPMKSIRPIPKPRKPLLSDQTKEYRECGYYGVSDPLPQLVPWNKFFLEYAEYLLVMKRTWLKSEMDGMLKEMSGTGQMSDAEAVSVLLKKRHMLSLKAHQTQMPFLSSHVIDCNTSFASAAIAMSLIDVSLNAQTKQNRKYITDGGVTKQIIMSDTPAIVFVKETAEFKYEDEDSEAELMREKDESTSGHLLMEKEKSPKYQENDSQGKKKPDGYLPLIIQELFVSSLAPTDPHSSSRSTSQRKYVEDGLYQPRISYEADIVITNPTSSALSLDVLMQIPEGSVPLNSGFYTRTQSLQMRPFSAETLHYSFYFPTTGVFKRYPVHLSKDGKIVAYGATDENSTSMTVIDLEAQQRALEEAAKLSAATEELAGHSTRRSSVSSDESSSEKASKDTSSTTVKKKPIVELKNYINHFSWEYLSQLAPNEELLRFIANGDIWSPTICWNRICWRFNYTAKNKFPNYVYWPSWMYPDSNNEPHQDSPLPSDGPTKVTEKEGMKMFYAVLSILASRMHYVDEIWKYSFLFNGPTWAISEYIRHHKLGMKKAIGDFEYCDTTLFRINPMEEGTISLYEYSPLINPRVYRMGSQREILNSNLNEQWKKFLRYAAHYPYFMRKKRWYEEKMEQEKGVIVDPGYLMEDEDLIVIVYYLLLQDRLEEAKELFSRLEKRRGDESGYQVRSSRNTPAASALSGGMGGYAYSKDELHTNQQATSSSSSISGDSIVQARKYRKYDRVIQRDEEMNIQYDYLRAYLDFCMPTNDEDAFGENGTIPSTPHPPTPAYGGILPTSKATLPALSVARSIASKYRDYPISRWRTLFADLASQIDEIDALWGVESETAAKDVPRSSASSSESSLVMEIESEREFRRMHQLEIKVKADPTFHIQVNPSAFTLTMQQTNGKSQFVKLRFYKVDIELLFSRCPFLKHQTRANRFSVVRPSYEMIVKWDVLHTPTASMATSAVSVDSGAATSSGLPLAKSMTIKLPEEMRNTNCFVEAEYCHLVRTAPLLSHEMEVDVIDHSGKVFVRRADTHAPLPQVYVKVYRKKNPTEAVSDSNHCYVRDGYTDLRGCFDYACILTDTDRVAESASSSMSNLHQQRYSILIMSDFFGADVREADSPSM